MTANSLKIFPQPQRIIIGDSSLFLHGQITFNVVSDSQSDSLDNEMPSGWQKEQAELLQSVITGHNDQGGLATSIKVNRQKLLPAEGYHLRIDVNGISIEAHDGAGLFYALKTLKQIFLQCSPNIPVLEIEDFPDLSLRGIMIDIGRGKIPLMKTLYNLIDLFSDLKINHLQLYMEGYSFAYQQYHAYFPDEAPITAEEIRSLDNYSRRRFIELVPCQNCLGHMEAWLALPAFNELAEVPEGLSLIPGLPRQTTTLDPRNPQALELVQSLFDELLPNFSSKSVNINLDEPYELGKGKNLEIAEKEGVSQLYFDYLQKILSIVRKNDKASFVWGDFLFQHPELLTSLPPDVTVLDWLYESKNSFEPHAQYLQSIQVPFVLCPGTSSWNSIAGRTDNMKVNICDAVSNALEFKAKGILLTDWGDYGHWQVLPVSYPAYVYGAIYSWNFRGNLKADAADYLDLHVFKDQNRVMGGFWQDLGNYYYFENTLLSNMTLTFLVLSPLTGQDPQKKITDSLNLYFQLLHALVGTYNNFPMEVRADYDYLGLKAFLLDMRSRLGTHKMICDDSSLIYREALFTLQLVGLGADLYSLTSQLPILPVTDAKMRLAELLEDLNSILESFGQLWPGRNRIGESVKRNSMGFTILLEKYKAKLDSGSEDFN